MTDSDRQLDRLRAELDSVDRDLLAAAARRTRIVQQIAETKQKSDKARPLFDRQRERSVYERARRIAGEVGLDDQLAHELMQTLVERSHHTQQHAAQHADPSTQQTRRFLMVGGQGRMARWLGQAFGERGHSIEVLDVENAEQTDALLQAAEIVMICVPMERVCEVIETIGPKVPNHALLCDINSLKQDVCETMSNCCAGETLGLHPMFGPTVSTLRRQKVVFCPVNPGPLAQWLREELGRMGAEIIDTDPATHDRMMAVVQVLVHFSTLVMGEALRRTGVSIEESLRFTSPIYRLELAFIGRLFSQNPRLYGEIEMANPYSEDVRGHFLNAAESLNQLVASGDRQAFVQAFQAVGRYFHEFADEAMAVSDMIIDTLVRRP